MEIKKSTINETVAAIRLLNLENEPNRISGSVNALHSGHTPSHGLVAYKGKKLIGWAAHFATKGQTHVYLVPEERGKGSGTELIETVNKRIKGARFCPWDERTDYLFGKLKVGIAEGFTCQTLHKGV